MIGGKELDLHVLYVEATNRGGYEKVTFFLNISSFKFSRNTHFRKGRSFRLLWRSCR